MLNVFEMHANHKLIDIEIIFPPSVINNSYFANFDFRNMPKGDLITFKFTGNTWVPYAKFIIHAIIELPIL